MKMIICRIRISKSNRTELSGLALQPRHDQERMMIFVGGTTKIMHAFSEICILSLHFPRLSPCSRLQICNIR